MNLLIDAGNTRIKWALAASDAAPGAWHAQGAVAHNDLTQLQQDWLAALDGHDLTVGVEVERVLISNVAGNALHVHLEYVLQKTLPALPPEGITWFASLPELAGLRNGYRNPAQLGCDRFAAAIAGLTLAPQRAVVVANCGTATTIDAITADGVFVGGMILPGLKLMASSLARNTAQLPQIAQDGKQDSKLANKLADGFADNTDDAILSGCLAAQSGAIEHACALHGAEVCIVSGGAAPAIAPMLKVAHRVIDNVVLIGLQASLRRA